MSGRLEESVQGGRQSDTGKSVSAAETQTQGRKADVIESMLPRKTSKYIRFNPYLNQLRWVG